MMRATVKPKSGAIMREGEQTTTPQVTIVPTNSKVTIVEDRGARVRVRTDDGLLEGWVSMKTLTPSFDKASPPRMFGKPKSGGFAAFMAAKEKEAQPPPSTQPLVNIKYVCYTVGYFE